MNQSKIQALIEKMDDDTLSDFIDKSKYVPHDIFYRRYFRLLRKIYNMMRKSNSRYWIRKYKKLLATEIVKINDYTKTDETQERLRKWD